MTPTSLNITQIKKTFQNFVSKLKNIPRPPPNVHIRIQKTQACPILIETDKQIQKMILEKYIKK